jgi:hypothetical protein
MKLLLLLVVALSISGCAGGNDHVDGSPVPRAYADAKERWSSTGISSYRFTISTVCFCVPEGPIAVVVLNGAVQGGTYVDTRKPVGASRLSRIPTKSGLSEIAYSAYARQAAPVRFTSDAALGYLRYLYIDYERRMADEEIG